MKKSKKINCWQKVRIDQLDQAIVKMIKKTQCYPHKSTKRSYCSQFKVSEKDGPDPLAQW
jgi:hypothetical protein